MIDEVVLLRHGRTKYNLVHRIQGQVDVPLDIVGQWQADQSGMELAKKYYWAKTSYIARHPESLFQPGPDAAEQSDAGEYVKAPASRRALKVVSSDLSRAVQTAHAFADVLGLPVELDSHVRERDFGRWEGLTGSQIRQLDPEAYASWRAFQGGERKYGVESRTALGERGVQALVRLVERDEANPVLSTLVVVTHGSFIAATIETLLGLDPERDVLGAIQNAHWSTLSVKPIDEGNRQWSLEAFNEGPEVAESVDWMDGPDELRNPDMPLMKPYGQM
ncbi:histidine phosphatase family protein [Bifidobacterium bombi]|uniref:Phosphoglycerate mutase family protein n=1 Tax=Bifidobacterium bombi DSM 19703 TaxID=1341695 RepID=A0A080N2L2_9BIFI|nr:histidine phosphatase family protein [Bifidobacterium bombi]KFF31086.1 phosphoglycerate mutase family protein [Bifidobacterium bombi DSM 19703]